MGRDVTPPGSAIEALVEGRHADPFSLLGLHAGPGGTLARALAPGADMLEAETLAGEGIEAEVIDLRTLRPLDKPAVLKSLAKTNRLVVVEEGWPTCSIASEVAAFVMEEGFDDLDAPVMRVTNADVPLPYAANLEKMALIGIEDVVATVKKVTNR